MSQRDKARQFMRDEGHAEHVQHLSVKPGQKSRLVDRMRTGVPEAAAAHTSYDAAPLDEDGLCRGGMAGVR
jgi:hypothetical protein